ncbi:hypothetical protein GCM10023144_08820 [Pigmentiphaga soli]|uniref:Stress-induced protein n=1 Tax=Pigmentiphaga soli TaxID=1007095 RepID=A0ABP8GL19_9BURK
MNRAKQTTPETKPAAGVHGTKPGDRIHSRSADPGQSSYGGFKGEDPRRQAQDLGRSDVKKKG